MESKKWYAITGRIWGDDEDTGMVFEASSTAAAVDLFRKEILAIEGHVYNPETYQADQAVDMAKCVHVTSVFISNTKIEKEP